MAKNYWKRQLISFNSNFRIDAGNPQGGLSGPEVYKIYGVTDDGDNKSSISLSQSGKLSIKNEHSIEIVGGTKNGEYAEDIVLIGRKGNISLSAAEGFVRIKAENIVLEADEDLNIKAGRNVNITSGGGRVLFQGNKIDYDAPTGNLINEMGKGFTQEVFKGSFVGEDLVNSVTKGSNIVLNTVTGSGGITGGILGEIFG